MLKVTLVKSKIGNTPANRATVKALGLNKIGSSNTFEDSASIRGMIHKVKHLLKVEEVDGVVVRRRQDGKAVSEKRAAKAAGAVAPVKEKAPAKAKAEPKKEAVKEESAEAKPKRTTKKKTEEAKS
ncbi:50S ribosomal protein L30 [Armatimonadetes bacterium Uphvl-Ar1]|nr:50S ribosomal protein L30 [Armatimonadetes bacterium Uphvl-Ar1]